jgi:ribonuclease D
MSPEPDATNDREPTPAVSPPAAPPEPEAPLLELRETLHPVVDSRVGLAEAAERIAMGTGPLAIDAERASGYRYSQRAYLVQLRRAGTGTILVDPVPFGPVPNSALAPLAAAAGDAEWILHAASQDLACLAELGMRPTRLFDTELAGRLLNYPRVSLAALVEELLGYTLRKEHSAVDWSRRPLPPPWLHYAALDVEALIELRDVLADQLEVAGRADWARQEFAYWAASGPADPRHEPWRRTSGIHRVRGRRGLALVRALWEQRDAIARDTDIASGRVVRDPALVEAAAAAPTSRAALGKLAGFRGRGAQRHLARFFDAVRLAQSLPEDQLPALAVTHQGPPPARAWISRFPDAAARLAPCRATVMELAEQHDLPQENLLSPDAVRRLAWDPPDRVTPETVAAALTASGARPWQVGLTARALAEALRNAPASM